MWGSAPYMSSKSCCTVKQVMLSAFFEVKTMTSLWCCMQNVSNHLFSWASTQIFSVDKYGALRKAGTRSYEWSLKVQNQYLTFNITMARYLACRASKRPFMFLNPLSPSSESSPLYIETNCITIFCFNNGRFLRWLPFWKVHDCDYVRNRTISLSHFYNFYISIVLFVIVGAFDSLILILMFILLKKKNPRYFFLIFTFCVSWKKESPRGLEWHKVE